MPNQKSKIRRMHGYTPFNGHVFASTDVHSLFFISMKLNTTSPVKRSWMPVVMRKESELKFKSVSNVLRLTTHDVCREDVLNYGLKLSGVLI
jgi:hypothetical protein